MADTTSETLPLELVLKVDNLAEVIGRKLKEMQTSGSGPGSVDLSSYLTISAAEEEYVKQWSSSAQNVMSEMGPMYANMYLKGPSMVAELASGGSVGKAHITVEGANSASMVPRVNFSAWNIADENNYSAFTCNPDEVELRRYKDGSVNAFVAVTKENGVTFQDETAGYVKLSELAKKSDITGGGSVDLSGYYTKSEIDAMLVDGDVKSY